MTVRLAATEYGDGLPLAILHGLFGSGRNWASIAQRLAWIRSGVYINQEKKGAERLLAESASEKKEKTDSRLNVEIEQNGGAKVTSPKPVN